jgi:hypothetical protein
MKYLVRRVIVLLAFIDNVIDTVVLKGRSSPSQHRCFVSFNVDF